MRCEVALLVIWPEATESAYPPLPPAQIKDRSFFLLLNGDASEGQGPSVDAYRRTALGFERSLRDKHACTLLAWRLALH